MFSFRYHAISLIAVFLALGIGVLLGVSVGEKGVVSGAREDLEKSLRGDLDEARSRNSDLRRELRIRDDFEEQAYPALVDGLLPGSRIGIVAIGDLPSNLQSLVREALEPAGADITSISVVRAPMALERLAGSLERTSFEDVDRDRSTLARLGERIGRQLGDGGRLIERVEGALFSSSRGEYRGLDGIVWVRDREGLKGDENAVLDRFEAALVGGMRSTDADIVGVETRDTDPSQVPFMQRQGLTGVDDLDLVAGRAALVFALLGADGHFGVKEGAGRLLPPAPVDGPSRR